MGGELSDQPGQMIQGAAKPIKFHAKHDVDAALANRRHHCVKTGPGELGTADLVGIFRGKRPAAPAGVFGQLKALGID